VYSEQVDIERQWDLTAHQALQPEMMQGETLLWSGRPLQRIIFRSSDWFAIPFSLLWGGFSLFWEWNVLGIGQYAGRTGQDAPVFFQLWGIPFVLIGQYMIWGRFFHAAWKKSELRYGVTNRRVIVLVQGRTRKVIDGALRSLSTVEVAVRPDGAGTVSFQPQTNAAWFVANSGRKGFNTGPDFQSLTFFDIPGARQVYDIIRNARDSYQ
jgi:hypothetical protein